MNDLVPIQELEWYQTFLEELKAVITETIFNSRIELIKGKWFLGKAITEKKEQFEKVGYGDKIIETLAKDLGVSAVGLWKCVQFYKKFQFKSFEETLNHLPEGKNISWYKITQLYLPKHRSEEEKEQKLKEKQERCEHSVLVCKFCGKQFKYENGKLLPL